MALAIGAVSGAAAQQDSSAAQPIAVSLTPVIPDSSHRLRWSPKGELVPLRLEGRSLVGSFPLGPAGTRPIAVKLSRVSDAARYTMLAIDLDRDGKFGASEQFTTTPSFTNYKWWSSFNAITVPVPVPAEDGQPATTRAYPINLWFVQDPADPDAKPSLRWSRSGWHSGEVEINGKPAYVLITEMEQDGVFDQRDSWAISRDPKKILSADPRTMDTHAWLDSVAYRPVRIDPNGRSIAFVPIRPATTEAEELAKADIYAVDRNAPRAEKPVAFSRDLKSVLAEASRSDKRVLVAFDAVWCGPCHTMDQIVYTSAPVAAAAASVLAAKVDGDEHPDLKKRYRVEAFPTMILLDGKGREIRRLVGYEGVADMVAFLKP